MRFFIPPAKSAQQTNYDHLEVWDSIRAHLLQLSHPTTERKIYSIEYIHNGRNSSATVGEKKIETNEPVIAILEAKNKSLFYCCTPNRGVFRGEPILIGNETFIQDFESDIPKSQN